MDQSAKNPTIIVLVILFTCMSIGATPPVLGVEQQVYTATTLDEEEEFDDDSSDGHEDSFDNEDEFEVRASGLDDAEDEFDDQDDAFSSEEKSPPPNLFLSALASLKDDGIFTFSQEVACHTDDASRITLNRTSLRMQWEHLFASQYFVQFDGKAAYNAAYDYLDYPDRTRGHYRFFTRVRQLYLQTGYENTSFKLGQQIVVWGESDGAVVTDIISPRDFTESVFTRIEDARLGQMILKADRYADSGQWTLLINPDPQVNIYAEPGHEYAGPSMTDALGSDDIGIEILPDDKLSHSVEDAEIGGRWKKTFGKSDISLMAATSLSNSPVFESQGTNPQGDVILRPIYPRYTMIGTAANRAKGNFLFKGELAYKSGRQFNYTNFLANNGLAKKDVIDVAFGLDYDANGACYKVIMLRYRKLQVIS